eukprot:scaffold6777_cov51-Attheya_sp.AAC.3
MPEYEYEKLLLCHRPSHRLPVVHSSGTHQARVNQEVPVQRMREKAFPVARFMEPQSNKH